MVSESPCGSEGEQKHKPFSAEWWELPKLLSLLPVCVIADCPKFWSSLAGHLILQGLQSWWSVEKGKKSRPWLWSRLPIALEGERCLRVLGLGPGALGVGSSLAQGEWKSSDLAWRLHVVTWKAVQGLKPQGVGLASGLLPLGDLPPSHRAGTSPEWTDIPAPSLSAFPTGLDAAEDSSWVFLWTLSYDRFVFPSPLTGN